jgi:hypothetical protein
MAKLLAFTDLPTSNAEGEKPTTRHKEEREIMVVA